MEIEQDDDLKGKNDKKKSEILDLYKQQIT